MNCDVRIYLFQCRYDCATEMKLIYIPILRRNTLIIESFLIHIGQFCTANCNWTLKAFKRNEQSYKQLKRNNGSNLYTRMCQTLFCIVCWINSHRDVVLALIKLFVCPYPSEWVRDRMLIVIVCLCLIMKIFLFAFFENCDKVDNDNEGNKTGTNLCFFRLLCACHRYLRLFLNYCSQLSTKTNNVDNTERRVYAKRFS